VARPTSSSTERRRRTGPVGGFLRRSPGGRVGVVVLILGLVQAVLFYDHFAVALTLVFGLGLGLWLRTWKAGLPALAAFVVAYLLAIGTGWLHDARPVWEPLLGGMLAVLGGAIGGGIFDVLRRDVDARAHEPARIDSMGRRL
jgi:ABC-type Mn2+/Zn2+ transport system permease subunit